MFSIQAKKRDLSQKISLLNDSGEIPAVYYGSGKSAVSISVPKNEFKKVWRDAGESTTIQINFGKSSQPVDALIQDVQVDPIKNEPIHVDFLVVDVNKSIVVSVPLEFVGVAPAVKNGIGSLVKVMHEIEVEALPRDLPQSISVDISNLVDSESQITIADVVAPAKVKIVGKPEEIVASIALQKEEKEDTGPIDLSAIEVEKKGKKEEEGDSKEA